MSKYDSTRGSGRVTNRWRGFQTVGYLSAIIPLYHIVICSI